MPTLLKLEQVALFLLGLYLFSTLDYAWWAADDRLTGIGSPARTEGTSGPIAGSSAILAENTRRK